MSIAGQVCRGCSVQLQKAAFADAPSKGDTAGLSVHTSDTTCNRGACDVQSSQGFLASSWRLSDQAFVALPCRMSHMRNDMCTHSLAYSMYPISYKDRPELPA